MIKQDIEENEKASVTGCVKEVVMKILSKSCRLHYFEHAYGCESSKVKLTGKKARC